MAESGELVIPEPYGGRLVHLLENRPLESISAEFRSMPLIRLGQDESYDAEKIGIGAYSPLKGFSGAGEFESITVKTALENGLPWSMPIVLAPAGRENASTVEKLSTGETALLEDFTGKPLALLDVEEKFVLEKEQFAKRVYGTSDAKHPNVKEIQEMGPVAIAGGIRLLRRLDSPFSRFELTPRESREHFSRMGWENVAAYQARNPPHLAHEYIQRVTLERDDVDAIFIQPVVGKLKRGDYRPEVIMEAYEAFVSKYYRKESILLASLSISMRYAGPKAVLFYAIVRRNYGCSMYIIGRDQAGVGDYYDPYAGHRIFDEFDTGVQPIRYRETYYCSVCRGMTSGKVCPHPESARVNTSQTKIRRILAEGGEIPHEIIRPEVASILSRGNVTIE